MRFATCAILLPDPARHPRPLPPAICLQVGNLSASDLRGLVSAEAFATLLSSAVDYDAAQRGGQNPALGTVTADTTLGELLDMLVGSREGGCVWRGRAWGGEGLLANQTARE